MSETPSKSKRITRRILRILSRVVLGIILLLVLVFILLQTPFVQNFARKKAQAYLQKKIKTEVRIGELSIDFFDQVSLGDIYFADQQKDTLLAGGKITVNVNLTRLLWNKLNIEEVALKSVTAKIKRELPDTAYNFQYIIDAFASGPKDTTTVSADSSGMEISLDRVLLDDIHLVYKDVVTGNDIDTRLGHTDVRISRFDLNNLAFDVPLVEIEGLQGKVYQTEPLVTPAAPDTAATETAPLQLNFKKISLQKIDLDYRNYPGELYTRVNLDQLEADVNKFDLDGQQIDLDKLLLSNTTAAVRLGKTAPVVPASSEAASNDTASDNGWRFKVASIRLDNNNIRFDDDNQSPVSYGMDYAHLNAKALTLHVDDFLFSPDTIRGVIDKGALKEAGSGFVLQQLETDFLYCNQGAYLHNLVLQTPGTMLRRSLSISYPSLDALQQDAGQLVMDIDLRDSKVQLKDVLTFVPDLRQQELFANPASTWMLNSRITGRLDDMKIGVLEFKGFRSTVVKLKGTLTGLPDVDKATGNLDIQQVSTTRSDLAVLLPPNTLPSNITIPERLTLKGTLKGGMQRLTTDLLASTSLGNISINGDLANMTDSINAAYDVKVKMSSLQLGVLLQDTATMGNLTATMAAKGKGYDPDLMHAQLKGTIDSFTYQHYTYRHFELDGELAQQEAQLKAGIKDPNITLSIDGKARLAGDYPAVQFTAMIDSLKTEPLHFTPTMLVYHGKITADLPVTDPDRLEGNIYVTESSLRTTGKPVRLDSMRLEAAHNDTGQVIKLDSRFAQLEMTGRYQLTQLGSIIQQSIQPYFSTQPADSVTSLDYNFYVNARVRNHPFLQQFAPDLTTLEPVELKSHFTDDQGWNATLSAPLIVYGDNRVENLSFKANTAQGKLNGALSIDQFASGTSMKLFKTNLDLSVARNTIDYALAINDEHDKKKYTLEGSLSQPTEGTYAISLKPGSLLLNYDKWTVPQDNLIQLAGTELTARHFALQRNGQELLINTETNTAGTPLRIGFTNFRLSTLAGFVSQDTAMASGSLDGYVLVSDPMGSLTFTSDLALNNLALQQDTIGNVTMKVNNTTKNNFDADIRIQGAGNDVQLNGRYIVGTTGESSMDMQLQLRQLQMKTVEGLSFGALKDASGSLNGNFDVSGSIDQPVIDGTVNFRQTRFNMAMLNSYFAVDGQKIDINNNGVRFNRFTIKDSTGNEAIVDGTVDARDFSDFAFNLDLTANDFHAMNTTKRDNNLYYGQLYFDADLHVKGTPDAPAVDGSLTVEDKTRLTVVMPQPDPGIQDREGIVQFVDMDAPPADTVTGPTLDSLNVSDLRGMDIAVNIEVKKEAELSLVIDEGNGDFLNVRGEATLTGGIDPSGKVTLAGSYELEDGAYEMTLNFLHKKFNIEKGSTIIWGGEPTDAQVNIQAMYVANTPPLDLVQDQLEQSTSSIPIAYRQKLPFEVYLKMEGDLMKPDISFDIVLPDDKSYDVPKDVVENVDVKLDQLRQDPSDMNKQVFALLLLNRFIGDNPFESGAGGQSAEGLARQSVSRILTDQLNRLASDLVQGVDLNFDVTSSDDDYSSGQRTTRTDLNVGLSKQLLNDRLTVTVGSNFELEGAENTNRNASNIAGDVSVNYRLSKDGRYMLRAYRVNEYEGALQGYLIETGVGFIINLDYEHFRDIFRAKKEEKSPATNNKEAATLPADDSTRKKAKSATNGK